VVAHSDGWTASSDGNRLYWRRTVPDEDPAAVLLFVHGLAEHSGRYRHVLDHFASRGFDCWSLDYRGHGQSPGRRVHVDFFDQFLTDLRAGHDLVRTEQPSRPLFLIGHSQGGLVTARYALAHPSDLSGVVLSSPFLAIHPDSQPSAALSFCARVLSAITPSLLLAKPLNPGLLSRDPAVGQAYVADPLVSRKISARWFTEVLAAHADTQSRAAELRIPALVMQSGDDLLVDPEITKAWAAAAPADLVEFVEWDGLYHEMFNEPEKEQVFDRVEKWLRRRLAGNPSS
jgi:alpha-beta hydrolase superfamily lysophospholipase